MSSSVISCSQKCICSAVSGANGLGSSFRQLTIRERIARNSRREVRLLILCTSLYGDPAGLPYLPPWLGWVTQFDARLWWKAELDGEKSLRHIKPRHLCRAGPWPTSMGPMTTFREPFDTRERKRDTDC